MKFVTAASSDVGIEKLTNQDSLMIKVASTDYGNVCFAAVCDGMGGLDRGELASASLIRSFSKWFEMEFPEVLYRGIRQDVLEKIWAQLIYENNYRLDSYSRQNHVKLGTTIVLLLLVGNMYYILNVGDSRAYMMTPSIRQLTRDQTVVQQEIDMGRLTPKEALRDPRRNMLLQCVGASAVIEPDFYTGMVETPCSFLLCSDGFRHVISPMEILEKLGPKAASEEAVMRNNLHFLIELDKYRQEKDNISAALIHVYQEEAVQNRQRRKRKSSLFPFHQLFWGRNGEPQPAGDDREETMETYGREEEESGDSDTAFLEEEEQIRLGRFVIETDIVIVHTDEML